MRGLNIYPQEILSFLGDLMQIWTRSHLFSRRRTGKKGLVSKGDENLSFFVLPALSLSIHGRFYQESKTFQSSFLRKVETILLYMNYP